MKPPSAHLRARLQERIEQLTRTDAAADWPWAIEKERGVVLIGGDNVVLWYIDIDGIVYSMDLDRFAGQLEVETNPDVVRRVLEAGSGEFPELRELLEPPIDEPSPGLDIHSPDGRWRARVRPDSRLEATTVFGLKRRPSAPTDHRDIAVGRRRPRHPGHRPAVAHGVRRPATTVGSAGSACTAEGSRGT